MRAPLTLLAAVPAIVASAVIPTAQIGRHGLHAARSAVVELELQQDQPKALFRVPCQGCLGPDAEASDDEAFLFDFQAHPSDEPCGISNITVNGIALASAWNGTTASGQGSFQSIPSGSSLPYHDLGLAWESSCLFANASDHHETLEHDGTAQVLTVLIRSIDGKEVDATSGFTISYRPVAPLELLRLSVVPDRRASLREFSESWRNPPARLRLTALDPDVLVDANFDESQQHDPSLQQKILELKRLEAKQQELQRLILEKKKEIVGHMKADVKAFKSDLKHCDNISCVFKTILDGAKGAIRVVYYKLKPQRHRGSFSETEGPFQASGNVNQQYTAQDLRPGGSSPPPQPPHHDHHGPPPGPPPPGSPPPHFEAAGHRHHPPPPLLHNPFLIALEVFLSVTGLGAVFAFVRRCLFTDRQRQDRAASREERRNARAYRRAARHLRWRRWFHGIDQERIEDYEEKRALIRDQEEILESAMQDEIRMLREAHNVVHSIVHAEEGRGFRPIPVTAGGVPYMMPHPNMSMQPYMHPHVANGVSMGPVRPPSRSSSLPAYHTEEDSMSEPPAYEEDEDSSDIVSDGFRQYTPSSSTVGGDNTIGGNGERWTPGSSVIETSPRPSMETLESRIDAVFAMANRTRSGSCSSSQFGGSEKSG